MILKTFWRSISFVLLISITYSWNRFCFCIKSAPWRNWTLLCPKKIGMSSLCAVHSFMRLIFFVCFQSRFCTRRLKFAVNHFIFQMEIIITFSLYYGENSRLNLNWESISRPWGLPKRSRNNSLFYFWKWLFYSIL